jgi:hypothetical protein
MNANMRVAAAALLAHAGAVVLSVPGWAQELGWSRYTDRSVGVSVDLPTELFPVDRGATEKLDGRTFATGDGRADVSVYSIQVAAGVTPGSFFRNRFQLPSSSVVYQRVTGRILAVSGYRRDKIWYARCNFAPGRANCVALNYPAAEKRNWDAVVTRISNSLSSPRA